MGKSSRQTTTQTSTPWSGVQPYLRQLYSDSAQTGANPMAAYPNQTYASFNPLEQAGQSSALDYSIGQYSPMTSNYQNTLQGMMAAPGNISQDPAVQAMMGANETAVMNNFQRNIMPQIDANAVAAGQLGGSRQGIAQGLAAGEATNALANANAQTMLGAYAPAAGLAASAASQFPGALSMGFMPSQTAMDIGGQQRAMEQQGIDENMMRYFYPQTSARESASWLNSILTGAAPYAGGSTTSPGASGAANALGGALSGVGAANFLSGAGAGIFGGTPTLAGLGALGTQGLYGGLGALLALSDRRLKVNIVPIGEHKGHKWYEFEYVWGGGKQVGVMAQEVQETNPDAVVEIDGYLAVDYSKLH